LIAKILVSLSVLVYAATVSVSTTNHQSDFGSYLSVVNNLLATDKGFAVAGSGSSSAGTSCSSPIQFGISPGTANTAITSGDFVYTVQVNSTSSAASLSNHNVTLVLASNTFGPLCIQLPLVPLNGQTIACKFDVQATTLPAPPYTFKVTVS
jgi:hypothetical protein